MTLLLKIKKICSAVISSKCELFRDELTVLIMTRPEHLIKRCAKHGLFNLLKYALERKEIYPIPEKACNYAVGNTLEHFKCFTYLYENYHSTQQIMNKFTISHKMARKDVPICYLEYLRQHCCYLEKSCDNELCNHTPWYSDCAETIVKHDDVKKLKYLHDINFKFDHNTAHEAIAYCRLSSLKFIVDNNLPIRRINSFFAIIRYEDVTESEALDMLKFLVKIGFNPRDANYSNVYNGPARCNYTSCVAFLIENGGRAYASDVMCAINSGNIELVSTIHKRMLRNPDNQTLINSEYIINNTAHLGYYDILVFLIESNYPINKNDAPKYAKSGGNNKCYNLLIEYGCVPCTEAEAEGVGNKFINRLSSA